MSKKNNSPIAIPDLERKSPDALLSWLQQAQMTSAALRLRIDAATFAKDEARVKELEMLLTQATKRAEFFGKKLADDFPGVKPLAVDAARVEQQVVVQDYIDCHGAREDFKLQKEASDYAGDAAGAAQATGLIQRMTRYLHFFKPRFEKIKKDSAR